MLNINIQLIPAEIGESGFTSFPQEQNIAGSATGISPAFISTPGGISKLSPFLEKDGLLPIPAAGFTRPLSFPDLWYFCCLKTGRLS
ncbi:MAG: hypothetical protein WCJ26_04300 [bacterium]